MKALLNCYVAIFLITLSGFSHADRPVYNFGIVPQQSATKVVRIWGPILKHLSENTGYQLRLKTTPSIPAFEDNLYKGMYDIAYMNPYDYTEANKKAGYLAFAKQKDKQIKGIIVAKKGSGITDISMLEGRTLAFPAPSAFAATMLPQALLRKAGIRFSNKYVKSHDSVYLGISRGIFSAGGGIIRTFGNIDDKVKNDLDVIWKSDGYTSHAFAAKKSMPKNVISKIQAAMLEMGKNPKGRKLLNAVNFKGIEVASDENWNDIRALNMTVDKN